MKKIFLSLIALVVLSITLSCGDLRDQLIGEWDMITSNSINVANLGIVYDFSKDSVFLIKKPGGLYSREGSWHWMSDENYYETGQGIKIRMPSSDEGHFYILTIENDIMTWKGDTIDITNTFKKK